jgi:hypothetical protein
MLTFHELIGFMSPKMANQILEDTQANNREVYRALVAAMAEAQKMRPVFIGRQPKERRHKSFVHMLSRAGLEEHAGNLIRGWLFKEHQDVLIDFLGILDIKHENGMVDDLPESVDDEQLNDAVDELLNKHDQELVAIYLTAFNASNENRWGNLDSLLANDERLQFHG